MKAEEFKVSEGTKAAFKAIEYLKKSNEEAYKALRLMYSEDATNAEAEYSDYLEKTEAAEAFLADLAADFANTEEGELRYIILSLFK